MIYVFDSNALITLFSNFYPLRFPSLWKKFEGLSQKEKSFQFGRFIMKLRDIAAGLVNGQRKIGIFFISTFSRRTCLCGRNIQSSPFSDLVRKQERLQGKPVADPFVIAKAKMLEGCVVTQESKKPNALRIPKRLRAFWYRMFELGRFYGKRRLDVLIEIE